MNLKNETSLETMLREPLVTVKGLISVLESVELAIMYNNPERITNEIEKLEAAYSLYVKKIGE